MSDAANASPLVVLVDRAAAPGTREEILERVSATTSSATVCETEEWFGISVGAGVPADEVARWESLSGVDRVVPVSAPYRFASRELFSGTTPVTIGSSPWAALAGGPAILAMVVRSDAGDPHAAPEHIAAQTRDAGGSVVHAGALSTSAFDDGTSVDAHRLEALAGAAHDAGLALCAEISDARQIEWAAHHADALEVGHRNMQNFGLLRELGRTGNTIVLKRGLGATLEEFLLAAEYVLANGNGRVILCEEAIAAPSAANRPSFEINAIPLLKLATHLPVIADPSHATVHGELRGDLARAAVAAGADGVCLVAGDAMPVDGRAAASSGRLVEDLAPVAAAVGRKVEAGPAAPRAEPPAARRGERRAGPDPVRDPIDVLRRTRETLAATIAEVLGRPPDLDLVAQRRISPPYPSWLDWMLHPQGDLLERWSRYRVGDVVLSRHLAYVDFARVDPNVLERLEQEEINLGQHFESGEVDRFGFEFGNGGTAGELDAALRRGHRDVRSLHPYVWRRYIAATAGRIGFLVIEALPSLTWRRLLQSEEERSRLEGVA